MSNIISIILFIASLGLFFGYVNPTYTHSKNLSLERNQYDELLANSHQILSERDKLLARLNAMSQADISKLGKLLPDSVDSVSLIIELSSIASKFGMRVRNFSVASEGDTEALGISSSPYGIFTFSFSTTASYETFIAFLKSLEQNLRLIDVVAISFGSGGNNSVYDFNMTIKTYWLK